MTQDYVRRAADWLVAHQNEDGGWGDTCASYMDDSLRGRGPSTASQTAWALPGLIAVTPVDYERPIRLGRCARCPSIRPMISASSMLAITSSFPPQRTGLVITSDNE